MKSQREGEEGKRIVTGKILMRLFLAEVKIRLTNQCLSHPLRFACLKATPLLSYILPPLSSPHYCVIS